MNDFLDLRIIKTRKLLITAWFNLLKDKTYQKAVIKVTEICKKADISQLTFYNHFNSKQDFFKFAITEQLTNKLPIPKNLKPTTIKQLVIKLFDVLFDFVDENRIIFKNSIEFQKNKGGEFTFINIFIEVVTFYVHQEINFLHLNFNSYQRKILALLIVGSIINCLLEIVKYEKNIDKKFVIEQVVILYNNISE